MSKTQNAKSVPQARISAENWRQIEARRKVNIRSFVGEVNYLLKLALESVDILEEIQKHNTQDK